MLGFVGAVPGRAVQLTMDVIVRANPSLNQAHPATILQFASTHGALDRDGYEGAHHPRITGCELEQVGSRIRPTCGSTASAAGSRSASVFRPLPIPSHDSEAEAPDEDRCLKDYSP